MSQIVYSPPGIFTPSLGTVTYNTPTISIVDNEVVYSPSIALGDILVPRTLTVPYYENLNYNTDSQKRIIDYFYFKILDKWLYSDLSYLLDYLTIKGNDVVVSKDKKAKKDESRKDVDKKIDFMEKYVLKKSQIGHFLNKFSNKYAIPWIYLYRHRHKAKRYLAKKIEKQLTE